MDLVDHAQNGYLIDARDHAAFSQALRELISTPDLLLEFRKSSLAKARDFDIQKVTDKYETMMQDVVNGK